MIEILTKTKNYITVKLPISFAVEKGIINVNLSENIEAINKSLEEEVPTAEDLKAIKKARKEFSEGKFLTLNEFLLKA